ncbi:MAG TPA: hypothetical protein VH590_11835 [Ktedonobacterales bacterium]
MLSDSILAFQIAGVLDLAGLLVAIWTIWSTISLTLGGRLLLAYRFIAVGGLAFALSHLLDTLLQASQTLNVEVATFLHQGVVTIAIFLFVAGLANLADDLPGRGAPRQMGTSLRLWPFVVGTALCISAFSFIIYGFSLVAEVWAFIWLEVGLVLLVSVCLALVLRARLGGAVGRSLWLAMLGLLIFGMAHPVQVWFYLNSNLTPGELGALHRLVVIPAFFLFAISITRLGQQLDRSNRSQATVRQTNQLRSLTDLSGGQPAPRHRPHPR